MKKCMILCSALLALAVFADEPAPSAEAGAAKGPRGMRGPRQAPLMLMVSDKTTDAEYAEFKKKVVEKLDSSFAEYKAKKAPEGAEKPMMHVGLMVMERRPGMGPGMRGERGQGPRGPRGDRGPRRDGMGDKGAPSAEAK